LDNTVKTVYKLVAMGQSKNLTEETPSINMNPNLEWMNYDNRNSTEKYG
jgi:hypothetical protein